MKKNQDNTWKHKITQCEYTKINNKTDQEKK